MKLTSMEVLFNTFNETAELLKEELSCTFLEALAETGENIFHQSILQEELSELTVKRLKKTYESLHIDQYDKDVIRKAFQLAILKGMKENVQPNHQMTPDSVGMLLGYLIDKFVTESSYRLLDPAVGTGNLLTTVIGQQLGKTIEGIGVDIDDLLVKLAYVNANLQKQAIQLYNQDSLEPLFIDPVNVVISDLPVGYYPNDIRALDYDLKADKGHSYAHHLFIEQSIRHVKEGGHLFLMIPNGLFESDQAEKLHAFMKEKVIFLGLIQLPLSMFKNKNAAKSILILQKKAEEVKIPKQALLVQMPSLSNKNEVENILLKINSWIKENR